MLPMAENTDWLDTDKEREMRKKKKTMLFDDDDKEEDHIKMSKQKGKTLPVPPKSTYKKKQYEIRSSTSVRNVLQRLKDQRAERKNRNRINTINERLQTEEKIVADIQKIPRKQYVEDVNIKLGKACKRI